MILSRTQRFTEKAIKVVMLAQEEARRLGHNFVGTEQVSFRIDSSAVDAVDLVAREERGDAREGEGWRAQRWLGFKYSTRTTRSGREDDAKLGRAST